MNPYLTNYEVFLYLKGYSLKSVEFINFTNLFDISLPEALAFSAIVFLIGIFGIITNKSNLILLLMAIELILLGVSLNFVFFSIFSGNILGYIYALLILSIAAAETSIGLALLVLYFRLTNKILLKTLINLKA